MMDGGPIYEPIWDDLSLCKWKCPHCWNNIRIHSAPKIFWFDKRKDAERKVKSITLFNCPKCDCIFNDHDDVLYKEGLNLLLKLKGTLHI